MAGFVRLTGFGLLFLSQTGIAAPFDSLTPVFALNCVSRTLRAMALERFILRCYWELCHFVEDLDEMRVHALGIYCGDATIIRITQ